MALATHVSPLGFGDWIKGPDSGRVTGDSETIVMEPLRSLTDGMEAIGHEAEVAPTKQTHHGKICSAPA
jgi:hypothetical protein